ncbi:unnamed protein product [Pleuronectes platessa]|uniref:Uncharacterized protein n=1 Tax=Pleuronectes platessa TaxID=8262 RepID=A0A9N7TX25_PLEPL|nr:unnamed protein product [Pleuronectes platessa]
MADAHVFQQGSSLGRDMGLTLDERWDSPRGGTQPEVGHTQRWDRPRGGTHPEVVLTQRWDSPRGGTDPEVGHNQRWDTRRGGTDPEAEPYASLAESPDNWRIALSGKNKDGELADPMQESLDYFKDVFSL